MPAYLFYESKEQISFCFAACNAKHGVTKYFISGRNGGIGFILWNSSIHTTLLSNTQNTGVARFLKYPTLTTTTNTSAPPNPRYSTHLTNPTNLLTKQAPNNLNPSRAPFPKPQPPLTCPQHPILWLSELVHQRDDHAGRAQADDARQVYHLGDKTAVETVVEPRYEGADD